MRQLFLVLFCLAASHVYSQKLLLSGPMPGNVELRTATIWMQVSQDAKSVGIRYKKEGENIFTRREYQGRLGSEFNPVKIDLTNLDMNAEYMYEVMINDKAQNLSYPLTFRTKELWQHRKPAPDFTFLAGSCSHFNEEEYDRPGRPYGSDSTIFLSMSRGKSAFMLWLGDNWYTREADWNSVWGLYYRPSYDRSIPVIQPLLSSMPHYGIWDDHDYGPNNGDKSYVFKDQSREVFMKYMCNPSYGEQGQGIYTKFSYADVDFFLTDDRYFRSNEKLEDSVDGRLNSDKTFFGPMQTDWLKNALLNSNATFKIVVCGNQVLNPVSNHEAMYKYRFEWQQLMHFLEAHKINGVIFLTGDRHHSEVIKQERPGLYPLYDITVSPLTAGISKLSGTEIDNPFREKNTLVGVQNYGCISVQGEKGKRRLTVEFINVAGLKVTEWGIDESALRIK